MCDTSDGIDPVPLWCTKEPKSIVLSALWSSLHHCWVLEHMEVVHPHFVNARRKTQLNQGTWMCCLGLFI